ncbi:ComF family protein [Streptomyces boluensis]|uniref:ComF family protein n=1 Tax=Streptomyces boluensis TaxID=1775135 RepID=A0A964UKQ8_9ACTN|nr:phosphoribosyltransferase family protein [Streptomyces boluensis]NBE51003.1 ComF family protein [Streptomyces boluensis]
MRGWWRDLADLVLPADCSGCGLSRTVLCGSCRQALHGRSPRRVRPTPEPAGLPVVHAAAPYEDAVRAVLLAHKERGALGLAEVLGLALAGAVRAGVRDGVVGLGDGGDGGDRDGTYGRGGNRGWSDCGGGGGRDVHEGDSGGWGRAARSAGYDERPGAPGPAGASETGGGGPLLLVPMPSARKAVAARGHDSVRRIALSAARELRRTGIRAQVLPVLRQGRRVVDQSGLNSRQRMANMSGALEVASGAGRLLRGRRVVLVDDLMTTGASLVEAARVLRAATAEVRVGGTQVAPTGRRPGSRERGRGGTVDASTSDTTSGAPRTVEQHRMFVLDAAVVASSPDSFEINRN